MLVRSSRSLITGVLRLQLSFEVQNVPIELRNTQVKAAVAAREKWTTSPFLQVQNNAATFARNCQLLLMIITGPADDISKKEKKNNAKSNFSFAIGVCCLF